MTSIIQWSPKTHFFVIIIFYAEETVLWTSPQAATRSPAACMAMVLKVGSIKQTQGVFNSVTVVETQPYQSYYAYKWWEMESNDFK